MEGFEYETTYNINSPNGDMNTEGRNTHLGDQSNVRTHNADVLPTLWPDNVELYQPLEGQILFSEVPNCLFVQAFLQMCNLKFTLIQKANAYFIGPSSEVPVLRCGKCIVSGAEEIVKFVEKKGISLIYSLEESQKIEMNSYISLVRMTLAKAEHFITWLDPETYCNVTRSRFCSVHPWPLGPYLLVEIKQKMQDKLKAMGCGNTTLEGVVEEVNQCFKALSDKLEENYFFGNKPTQLDALVFAHAFTIMKNPLPRSQFCGIIHGYPKVVKHCYSVMEYLKLNSSNQFGECVTNLSL